MKPAESSFATVEELMASWKTLTLDEQSRAEVLLLQASNYLRQVAYNNNKDIDDNIAGDPSGVYEANVKTVVISAVQRSLASPLDMMPDASQWSQRDRKSTRLNSSHTTVSRMPSSA